SLLFDRGALPFDSASLSFDRAILRFDRAFLSFDRMVLQFDRMILPFDRMVLPGGRRALRSRGRGRKLACLRGFCPARALAGGLAPARQRPEPAAQVKSGPRRADDRTKRTAQARKCSPLRMLRCSI